MATIKTKNLIKSVNSRSITLKDAAIKDGCELLYEEWRDGIYYFHARKSEYEKTRKGYVGVYSEAGSCFNMCNSLWSVPSYGHGKIEETCIVEMK